MNTVGAKSRQQHDRQGQRDVMGTEGRGSTSSKKTDAMWWYKGDLKAKSTVNDSQVDCGVGPGLKSHVESK